MLDIDSLATDPKASEEGVWLPFLGAKFLVARHNNDKASQLRSKLALDNWDIVSAGDDKALQFAAKIDTQVLAEAVLLDWDDLFSGGKKLKYTPALSQRYMEDVRFRDLRQFIENSSFNRAHYREVAEAEVADSVKSSADS
jgi:hypothetical protein